MDKYLEQIEKYILAAANDIQHDLDAGFDFADVWMDHWADLGSTLEMILKDHIYAITKKEEV